MATLDDTKLPFLQLVVADYLRDTRHLSLAARGAWVDILCAMHVAQDRGVVVYNRLKLARALGTTTDQVDGVLEELRDADNATGAAVCEFTDLGGGNFKLTSRRMVRDEHRRQVNRQNGQRGGNPRLLSNRLTERDNRDLNPPDKPPVNPRVRVRDRVGDESPSPSSRPSASRRAVCDGINVTSSSADTPGPSEHRTEPSTRDQRPRKRQTARVLSDEQNDVRTRFITWWCDHAYPRQMQGVPYDFNAEAGRNGRAVKLLLEASGYRLDRAQAIANAYLSADIANVAPQYRARPLYGCSDQLQMWAGVADGIQLINGARHARYARPSAAQRGECAEPDRDVPDLTPRAPAPQRSAG